MISYTVCVGFSNYLSLTIPHNRHHFEQMIVVTSTTDHKTINVCKDLNVSCLTTNLFYEDGADFNKYRALEYAFDVVGRVGWMAILDADIFWPKDLGDWRPKSGNIYCPYRFMCPEKPGPKFELPNESDWTIDFPKWRVTSEFSGYSQIFHAQDKRLTNKGTPWHPINWKHAGGGDSEFQAIWPTSEKIRPNWSVLHIGEPGTHWCGVNKKSKLDQYMRIRRSSRTFDNEKIQELS